MDCFKSSLRMRLPEGENLPEGNVFPFTTEIGEMIFIIPENDPETILCRAHVGSLEGVVDRAEFLKAALSANLFWSATDGMTLALDENDQIFLQSRYEDAAFEDPDALGTTVAAVNGALETWKARLNVAGGKTDERA